MVGGTAFPFLTIPDKAVSCEGFLIGDPDAPLQPAGSVLEHWDYVRDLRAGLDLQVDMRMAAEALAIPHEKLKLGVRLTAGTGAGRMPRSRITLDESVLQAGADGCSLRSVICSGYLSGRLLLQATIILAESPFSAGSLAPKMVGSRLWELRRDILLEGGGDSRFPIESLSFSRSQYFQGKTHKNAPWFFYWRPNAWGRDFSAVTRLYVNSDNASLEDRVVAGDPLTLQSIIADVMSQLIGNALDVEGEDIFDVNWEEGTLGYQIRYWAELAFPGMGPKAIASLRNHRPGEFRAAILAAASVED